MIAFIHVFLPVIPALLLFGAGAATVAACKSGGKKKARIAELKARVEALERKA